MPTTAPPFAPATLAELDRRLHDELDRLTRVGVAGRADLEAVAVESDVSDLLDPDEPDGGTDEPARQRGRVLVAPFRAGRQRRPRRDRPPPPSGLRLVRVLRRSDRPRPAPGPARRHPLRPLPGRSVLVAAADGVRRP